MLSPKQCKIASAVAAFTLAACQSESTTPVYAPEGPSVPIIPIPGTFAFSRVAFRVIRPFGFVASVFWIRDRAVREIADPSNRFLLQPALSPDGTRLIVTVTNALDVQEYGDIQLGGGDLFLIDAVATSDGMVPLTTTGSARSPDWSSDGQRIVFVSGLTAQSHIYVLPASGGPPLRITSQEGSYETPRWSPDGRRIAFTDLRDGRRDIFVMNANGSSLVNLTPDAWSEASPSWSPSGKSIAFSSTRASGLGHIFTVDSDGTNLTRLTPESTGSSEQPVWSPDGLQIAFVFNLYQANAYLPSIGSGIYVMYADGSHQRQLTVPPPLSGFDRQPAWSR